MRGTVVKMIIPSLPLYKEIPGFNHQPYMNGMNSWPIESLLVQVGKWPSNRRLGIRGVYVNSYIVDEGAPIKTSRFKVDGCFIQTRFQYNDYSTS